MGVSKRYRKMREGESKMYTMRNVHAPDKDYGLNHWYFYTDMRGNLFPHCESNYDIETILRRDKVISPKTKTDTEFCAIDVHFSSKKSAENFIERLNKYLDSRKVKLAEMRRF